MISKNVAARVIILYFYTPEIFIKDGLLLTNNLNYNKRKNTKYS